VNRRLFLTADGGEKKVIEMSETELVKEGCLLDEDIKKAEKKLTEIKSELKSLASREDKKSFSVPSGDKSYVAKVSAHTVTSVSTEDFISLAEELNVPREGIARSLSVKVGEAKKVVPEDRLNEIANTRTEAYGKLQFKIQSSK
jgi:hypothetical protein